MNFHRKNKKKTTLQKQWTRNIMILILVLFIGFGLFIYTTVNMAAYRMLSISMDAMGKIAARELSQHDIKGLIDSKDADRPGYRNIVDTLESITERSEDLLPNIYIFAKDSNQDWIYIVDASSHRRAQIGDAFPYVNKERELVYETTEVHTTNIEQDFFTQQAHMAAYIPIVQNDEVVAILGLDVNTSALVKLQVIFLTVLVGLMAICLFVIWWMVRLITKRQNRSIEKLVNKMKEMAELKGDLTKRIDIEDNNEIGELANYTNKMMDTLQSILLKVEENSKHLVDTSKHFSKSFEEVSTSFSKMNTTVDDVTTRIIGQTGEMSNTTESIVGMHQAINEIAEYSQQVTAEAADTETHALEGNGAIKKMKNQMDHVGQAVNETTELMTKLDQHSNEINSIVETITAISKQTNLLALNASIEAARAGEHGQGFRVVAEEVRTLAEESSKSADEISKLLGSIREEIINASRSMQEVSHQKSASDIHVEDAIQRFEKITSSIQKVSSMVEEVSASTEEITATTAMISESMTSLKSTSLENTESVEEVASSIDSESKTIEGLLRQVLHMETISDELNQRLSKLKLK
ncbi:Methyl-accepting chemotaxis protein [Natronincola peptidivorans]|uniref:Methyl-accepting chemotaxis protein n=1 Tax=Natronincola peptidivorans TaxID=426128 RepID=A0A1I0DD38_9FIRM|nr:methyl-accepting chemotaxis protein [Natronincola peptidivorans]SET29919.1 Methyl-accepting chemotaxis protein [Natronincola peptidivorans]